MNNMDCRFVSASLARWLNLLLLGALVAGAVADDNSDKTDVFRYETRRTRHTLNVKRHRHATVDLGQGRIGVFAGFGRGDAEIFDSASETFEHLPLKRWFSDFHGIAIGQGKALLVDGIHDCIFDISSRTFIPTINTFHGAHVRWPGMLPLPDGKIFLCGGFDADFSPIADCAVFDPDTLQFTPVGKLQVPRAHATVNLIGDDRILVTGGSNAKSEHSSDTLEMFDIARGVSTLLPTKLTTPRGSHAGIVLPDGQVLLAGGYDGGPRMLRSAETFDPKTGKVAPIGSMGIGRNGPQTALLPSGRVAFFGGRSDSRAIEVYCPTESKFILADQLLIDARWSGFTATPLEGGGVLVIAGRINNAGDVLDGAEIFTERRSQGEPGLDVGALVGQLGHNEYTVREAATRKLIEMGPDISTDIRKLLRHEDPEIRTRAAHILKAVTGGGNTPKWCVEVWKNTQRQEILWFEDYRCPEHWSPDEGRVLSLKKAMEQHKATRLVVRFPPQAQYATKVSLIDLVGWSRFPIIHLGDPL